jgi:hypothetical protein
MLSIAVPSVSLPDLTQCDAGGDGYQGRFALLLTRWPPAILYGRHRLSRFAVRPGRRNGVQPNKETAEESGNVCHSRETAKSQPHQVLLNLIEDRAAQPVHHSKKGRADDAAPMVRCLAGNSAGYRGGNHVLHGSLPVRPLESLSLHPVLTGAGEE